MYSIKIIKHVLICYPIQNYQIKRGVYIFQIGYQVKGSLQDRARSNLYGPIRSSPYFWKTHQHECDYEASI